MLRAGRFLGGTTAWLALVAGVSLGGQPAPGSAPTSTSTGAAVVTTASAVSQPATTPSTSSAAAAEPLTALPWGNSLSDYLRLLRDPAATPADIEKARARLESEFPVQPATPATDTR